MSRCFAAVCLKRLWAWLVQVSDQAVRLWQEGWFQGAAQPSGVSALRNPKVRPALTPAPRHACWLHRKATNGLACAFSLLQSFCGS